MLKNNRGDGESFQPPLTSPGGSGSTPALKYVLVLGPHGCGKSSLIGVATGKPPSKPQSSSSNASEPWSFPREKYQIGDQSIKLINSPGFAIDDPSSFRDMLGSLMDFLITRSRQNRPLRFTGILYIHSERIYLENHSLGRILHMFRMFVGDEYLERVTILIKPQTEKRQGTDVINSIKASELGSPFYSFHRFKSKFLVIPNKPDRHFIDKILGPYLSLDSRRFFAQDRAFYDGWKAGEIASELQGLFELPMDDNRRASSPLSVDKDEEVKSLDSASGQEKEKGSEKYPGLNQESGQADEPTQKEWEMIASNSEAKELEATYKEQIDSLQAKLQRTEAEYASLRSHLQVEDNIEQMQITRALDDINRLIEELGQSLSEYLVDNCSEANASLQGACSLQELLNMFGHTDGKSSLVKSSRGDYPDLEDFFYFAIRATLCSQLFDRVFKPFHPKIADQKYQDDFMIQIHNQIAYREPQSVAGRWRKDAFNAISNTMSSDHQTRVNTIYEAIVGSLRKLLESYFSPLSSNSLNEEHETTLKKLANMAEGLNQLLKGDIVFLGDFRPMAYPSGSDFQPDFMSELGGTRSEGTKSPQTILATVELGLVKHFALGGNQEPQKIVVRNASIVSDRIYFRRKD